MWPTGYNKTFGHPAASKQVYWIRKHAGTLYLPLPVAAAQQHAAFYS
jgi:hypothetical protein